MAKQKYVLTEIKVSDFEPGAVPTPGRFKLVSPCAEPENRRSAAVLTAISALKSAADQRQALAGLKHLLKVAQLGKPFNLLLDKDAVHEAFPAFFAKSPSGMKRFGGIGAETSAFCFITQQTRWCC